MFSPDLGTESDDIFSSEYSGSRVAHSRYDRYSVLPGFGRQLRIGTVALWQTFDSKDRRRTINTASCPFGAISSTTTYPDTEFKAIQKEVSPYYLIGFVLQLCTTVKVELGAMRLAPQKSA